MLGRTANGLFWMFRYLERAENTARLLEAALRMALTRDLVTAEAEWRSVIATLGLSRAYESLHDGYDGVSVWNFVLRGPSNPGNVRAMFGAVRSNARMARINISGDVWEAVNENWMKLDALLARPVGQMAVGEVLSAIRRAGTQVHGAFDGSMLRDEGYHFSRAGTFIERADSTARILDMKYFLLLPSLSYVGSSLDPAPGPLLETQVTLSRDQKFALPAPGGLAACSRSAGQGHMAAHAGENATPGAGRKRAGRVVEEC